METTRYIELSATSFSDEDRIAVLVAFRERAPIIIRRADGTEFARILPTDDTSQPNVNDNPGHGAVKP